MFTYLLLERLWWRRSLFKMLQLSRQETDSVWERGERAQPLVRHTVAVSLLWFVRSYVLASLLWSSSISKLSTHEHRPYERSKSTCIPIRISMKTLSIRSPYVSLYLSSLLERLPLPTTCYGSWKNGSHDIHAPFSYETGHHASSCSNSRTCSNSTRILRYSRWHAPRVRS